MTIRVQRSHANKYAITWGTDHTRASSQEEGFRSSSSDPATKSSLSSRELRLGGFGGLTANQR